MPVAPLGVPFPPQHTPRPRLRQLPVSRSRPGTHLAPPSTATAAPPHGRGPARRAKRYHSCLTCGGGRHPTRRSHPHRGAAPRWAHARSRMARDRSIPHGEVKWDSGSSGESSFPLGNPFPFPSGSSQAASRSHTRGHEWVRSVCKHLTGLCRRHPGPSGLCPPQRAAGPSTALRLFSAHEYCPCRELSKGLL